MSGQSHSFLFAIVFFGFQLISFAQNDLSLPLNGTWNFQIDPNNVGKREAWYKPDVDGSSWDNIQVPGNWDLKNEYAHYVGKGWYQKVFTIPDNLTDKTFILHFEAVYHDCEVWLNGQKLGTNDSGFLPFEFEVTSLIHSGQENVLTVCADNTFKRGAIWNWGGIRRLVSLLANDGIRIVHQHITPEVDLEKKEAKVTVKVFLENYSGSPTTVSGDVLLSNKTGFEKNLSFSADIPARSSEEVTVNTSINQKDFHLWHFDDPFLYQSEVKLDDRECPSVRNNFGLRKVEIDSVQYQFKLNGDPVRLMGLNLVPDSRTTGNTLPLWRIKQDVDLLKSLNGNFARLSHLPLPEEMMDYLDERGILVFSEIPLWGYDPLADPDNEIPFDWLQRLIHLQYNHASVVGWSTGNEIGYFPTADAYVKKSIDFARKLDSTRLVSNVTYTAQNENDYIRYTDLGLLNKYNKNLGPVTRLQHTKHPGKVLFYSEYGIGQFSEGLDGTLEIKPLIDSIRNLPYLVGASLWTFNDYRSSYEGTKELSENRPWGVVDVYRRKKQAFFDLQKEHAPIKELEMVSLETNKAKLKIIPRPVLDLPAYILRNYKLVYHLQDEGDNIVEGNYLNLPVISPGDPLLEQEIQWKSENAFSMKIALLNPQLDVVLDTTVFFNKPLVNPGFTAFGGRTQHNNISPNTGAIRVFHEKSNGVLAYRLKYGIENLDHETEPSREDYLDIPGLVLDETYQVQLVAINPKGKAASDPVRIKVDQRKFLPPGIRYVEPADQGFFVAYSSDVTDFLYRVKYRETGKGESEEKILQSRTPGQVFIPGLKNGVPYSFQVQRVTDNNSYSQWSKEYLVVPDGGQLPDPPEIKGVFRKGEEAIIPITPGAKAIGYELEYREKGSGQTEWSKTIVHTSLTEYVLIQGLKPKRTYEFRLAAYTLEGKSNYSAAIEG